jgi:hypothetical protein
MMPSTNTSLKTSNPVVHFCGIAISVVDPDPEIPLFIMSNLTHLLYKAEYKGKIYGKSRILEQIYVGSETESGFETN